MNMYLEHLLIGLPWKKKRPNFFSPWLAGMLQQLVAMQNTENTLA